MLRLFLGAFCSGSDDGCDRGLVRPGLKNPAEPQRSIWTVVLLGAKAGDERTAPLIVGTVEAFTPRPGHGFLYSK